MIEVKVSDSLRERAIKKADDLGKLKNSITKGKGNVVGFIAELLIAKHLKIKVDNTYDYDLIKNGLKLDVKAKTCSSPPKPEYDCSVAAYNIKQACDYYVFVRVHQNLETAWILGAYKKEDYFNDARFCKAGEKDPNSSFGWTFKADCYNIQISQLIDLEKIFK
jgi:hypothetical protein